MPNEMDQDKKFIRGNISEADFLNGSFNTIHAHAYNRIFYLCGMLWAASKIYSWAFDMKDGHILQAFNEDFDELSSFFVLGGCFDYVKSNKECQYPFLLSDSLGLMWIAMIHQSEGHPTEMLYVFGPVFNSAASPVLLLDKLRKYNFSVSLQRRIETILDTLPVVSLGTMSQYACMLYYALTGGVCHDYDLNYQSTAADTYESDGFDEETTYETMRPDGGSMARLVQIETDVLNGIRTGSPDVDRMISQLCNLTPFAFEPGNNIRNIKDESLIYIALTSRAAISGGLPVRTAKSMELGYFRRIESASTTTEIRNILRDAFETYSARVREVRSTPEISAPVRQACEYILANLTAPITFSAIASQVGYSEYYLSRKFNKEMGIKISDYINSERIKYATQLLKITDLPISEIAARLQYGNQSYFGRIFKQETGMTPAQYRKQSS